MSKQKIKSTDFDQHIGGRHLEGPTPLTIMHVGLEAMGRPIKRNVTIIAGEGSFDNKPKQQEKMILFFRETTKDLPLSNINRHKLEELCGVDPAGWIGKIVILAPVEEESFGKKQLPARITGLGQLKVDRQTGEIKPEQDKPLHWAYDPPQRAQVTEAAEQLSMSKEEILSALNVERSADFQGTAQEAVNTLKEWRLSHPRPIIHPLPQNFDQSIQEGLKAA